MKAKEKMAQIYAGSLINDEEYSYEQVKGAYLAGFNTALLIVVNIVDIGSREAEAFTKMPSVGESFKVEHKFLSENLIALREALKTVGDDDV